MKKLIWFLTLPFILGGCSLSLTTATLPQITIDDQGKNFSFEVDQQFQIVLPANPTTGYQWAVEDITEGVLEFVKSDYQLAEEDEDIVGAGGEEIMTFKVFKVERSHIVLEYRRPWDEMDIANNFLVTINGNPGDDGLLTFVGTIHSTSIGDQYDDYFETQDGDKFGIESFMVNQLADPGVIAKIAEFKDTDGLVEIRGKMLEDTLDYGGKQLIIHEIQAK